MGYFDDPKNVEEYIVMCEGFDGRELVEKLSQYFEHYSTVLEIGMGPGKDLDILSDRYHVTGSDLSEEFLRRYRTAHPDADLMKLDAVNLKTDRTFDCIYSNKVLHHLSKEELVRSLMNQYRIVTKNGIVFHTFWYGDREETLHGLSFQYYKQQELKRMFLHHFNILEIGSYTEMEDNDSIFVIAKKT